MTTTSEENIIDRLAAAESLLGMLQRGRGAGYLAALNTSRKTVWPLLIECITNDPRLDQECEDRTEYYASLILATAMDLAPLYSLLKQNDNQEHASSLPMDTLIALAERGSKDALQVLRDYISWGRDWTYVILCLADLGESAALDGIDEVMYQRVISDPDERAQLKLEVEGAWQRYCDLDAEDRSTYRLMLPVCEPWKTLCQRNRKLADLFDSIGIAYLEPPPPKVSLTDQFLAGLSVRELFDCVDKSNRLRVRDLLDEKVCPADESLLLENLSSDNIYRARLALWGLGKLGTVKAFEAVKTYIEGSENASSVVRADAFQAIAEMPGHFTLETARQWFRRKEYHLHFPAGWILENHATLEDVPLLIEALRTPATIRSEDFRLAGALDALARFEAIGPIPEVEQVFCQTPDCFDRYRAAKAMSVTAPVQFRDQYAFDCMWDCHWDTRKLGCKTVSLSAPGALDRLREIEADACKSDEVREAARRRLSGL